MRYLCKWLIVRPYFLKGMHFDNHDNSSKIVRAHSTEQDPNQSFSWELLCQLLPDVICSLETGVIPAGLQSLVTWGSWFMPYDLSRH